MQKEYCFMYDNDYAGYEYGPGYFHKIILYSISDAIDKLQEIIKSNKARGSCRKPERWRIELPNKRQVTLLEAIKMHDEDIAIHPADKSFEYAFHPGKIHTVCYEGVPQWLNLVSNIFVTERSVCSKYMILSDAVEKLEISLIDEKKKGSIRNPKLYTIRIDGVEIVLTLADAKKAIADRNQWLLDDKK